MALQITCHFQQPGCRRQPPPRARQVFLHIQERILAQRQAEKKDVPYSSMTFLPTKSDRSGPPSASSAWSSLC